MSLKFRLLAAIESHDNEKVSEILKKTDAVVVNEKMYIEMSNLVITNLHAACYTRNNHALELLLAIPGIHVNAKTNELHTPLHVACVGNNQVAVAKLLACPGVEVNPKGLKSWTPLHFACHMCHSDVLNIMLMDSRVDIDLKNKDGKTAEMVLNDVNDGTEGKKKCREIFKRTQNNMVTRSVDMEQENDKSSYGDGIEKMNVKIKDMELKSEERLNILKGKRKTLNEMHSWEHYSLTLTQKDEQSKLDEKHRDERFKLDVKQEEEVIDLEMTIATETEANENNLDSLIKIRNRLAKDLKKRNDHSSIDEEADRAAFECPVCLEQMKPPTRIWMCQLNHIVCGPCRNKLDGYRCPICTTKQIYIRAFLAENFARIVYKE